MNDYKQDARDLLENVPGEHYEVYADMVMRSLRGSWRSPQRRIFILEELAGTDIFTEDVRAQIESRCESFKTEYFSGWHDGRTFRYVYEEQIDVDYGAELARELSAYIPDDQTWDEFKFERMEDTQE